MRRGHADRLCVAEGMLMLQGYGLRWGLYKDVGGGGMGAGCRAGAWIVQVSG